jgi:hypothetical protein
MSILNGYKYLLYRIYQWQLAWFGEKQNPKFVAIVGCSIFICFNIQTVIAVFEIATGNKIYIENINVVAFWIFLLSLNSYIFLHLDKFDNLIEEFSKESESSRKKNTVLCWAYVIFTHAVFFISILILSP